MMKTRTFHVLVHNGRYFRREDPVNGSPIWGITEDTARFFDLSIDEEARFASLVVGRHGGKLFPVEIDTEESGSSAPAHSALPWFADGRCRQIVAADGAMVAEMPDLFSKDFNTRIAANATLIVRAVNSHDDLVGALERLCNICMNPRALRSDIQIIAADGRLALARAKEVQS